MRSSSSRRRTPKVLVFGENLHDSQSLVELLIAVNPRLQGRVAARPRPISLTRDAGLPAVRRWVSDIAAAVSATVRAGQPVEAVVVHRDADGPDPAGNQHARLAAQLANVPVPAHPVVPVQAIEAWWLLHPRAFESVSPRAWRDLLAGVSGDVEAIDDPKRRLISMTRPSKRTYSEADSVAIARAIRTVGIARRGQCSSLDRLADVARQLG